MNASLQARDETPNQSLGTFLLDLYATANRTTVDRFRSAVFEQLERLIPMDSGWWGGAVAARPRSFIVQAVLHELPSSFIDDYASLIDADLVSHQLRHELGATLAYNGCVPGDPAELESFDLKYRLHSSLSTHLLDRSSGTYLFISLFRSERHGPFSEHERMLLECIKPHLALAWSLNRRLADPDACPDAAAAVVDARGRIVDATPGFIDAMRDEFPHWSGSTLPGVLHGLVGGDRLPVFRGRRMAVRRKALGQPGLYGLRCDPPCASRLAPRKEAVATAYASGDSYKQIAAALQLSPATVRTYLRQCYETLGVRNKTELGAALKGDRGHIQ